MAMRFDALMASFQAFGLADTRVSSLVVIGSQARQDTPADAYSDLDMIMVVDDPAPFLDTDEWLDNIAPHHISFVEYTIDGQREKRVMFEGALDVDMVVIPLDYARTAMAAPALLSIFSNGYRVLVDKLGLVDGVSENVPASEAYAFPTEAAFGNMVQDFWYHCIWTGKKLLRGELWAAKFCVDVYMKNLLRSMIECYEHTRHGLLYNTWHGGRFLDRWADADIRKALTDTFARYDRADMVRALHVTMDLYRRVASASAMTLGYPYPDGADAFATQWVSENLDS